MTLKYSFPPVVDENVQVLVLGSLPGEQSLAQSQYYANRNNRFWALVGDVVDVNLVVLSYAARLEALMQHRIGLWDVVASASRDGSLDSRIRNHTGNDIVGLIQSLPNLRAIAFNGGTAARHGLKQLGAQVEGLKILQLPSSSPAYTLPYEQKLQAWRALKVYL
ncbi:MAG: DNA-deoxyinosine glycosylase [Burkholderiaceae bacterium]|nr:DNA-deoxyinosine glycosylase [Roseateles sp.]MBV8471388.1 DNA-deoxyinosine glycosylase [Burkholderiaceae bacterium]